tara:strand:- start:212 stop:472 length:261 start_codon:yes stop_codon:yes gene_type:complete
MPSTNISEETKHNIKVTKLEKDRLKKIQSVKITDFDMPFGSMVKFMIKWALASVPAIFIIFFVGLLFSMIFFSFFGTIMYTSFNQY